jgi:ribosomal protein S18 acetylase RimI-like enzyme
MITRDWRDASDALVESIYADEIARWRRDLSWETDGVWHSVDAGRRMGTVPGFVALDAADRAAGWCFFLLDGSTVQVGGFRASSEGATRALVTAVAESPEGRAASGWSWFGYFDAPGLAAAIVDRGGAVAVYRYMHCRLTRGTVAVTPDLAGTRVRAWRQSDAAELAAVLASAYGQPDAARPFAPSGQMEEWRRYAVQLLSTTACGVFDPRLSLVSGAEGGTLDAAAVLTRVSPTAAHVAQLAVRAGAQAKGLGRALLDAARAQAAREGCTELTLLVHEGNARAVRLYEEAGFAERAAFLSAAERAA